MRETQHHMRMHRRLQHHDLLALKNAFLELHLSPELRKKQLVLMATLDAWIPRRTSRTAPINLLLQAYLSLDIIRQLLEKGHTTN